MHYGYIVDPFGGFPALPLYASLIRSCARRLLPGSWSSSGCVQP